MFSFYFSQDWLRSFLLIICLLYLFFKVGKALNSFLICLSYQVQCQQRFIISWYDIYLPWTESDKKLYGRHNVHELKSLVSSLNQWYLNQKHHIHNSVPLTIILQLFQCLLFKFEDIHKVINSQGDGEYETVEKHAKEKTQYDTPNKGKKGMEGIFLFAWSVILYPEGFLTL